MANIFLVLGTPDFTACCAMDVTELAEWHERALERAPKKE